MRNFEKGSCSSNALGMDDDEEATLQQNMLRFAMNDEDESTLQQNMWKLAMDDEEEATLPQNTRRFEKGKFSSYAFAIYDEEDATVLQHTRKFEKGSCSSYAFVMDDEEEATLQQEQEQEQPSPLELLSSMDNLSLDYNQTSGDVFLGADNDSVNFVRVNYQPEPVIIDCNTNVHNSPAFGMGMGMGMGVGVDMFNSPNLYYASPSPRIPAFQQTSTGYHIPNLTHMENLNNVWTDQVVVNLAKVKDSSSKLQQLIKSCVHSRNVIYNAVKHRYYELMIHPVGCHFLSKLIQHCDVVQISNIVTSLVQNPELLVPVCYHKHATHVIQKIIKVGKKIAAIACIPIILAPHAAEMMVHQTARHVVEACFINLNARDYKPLYYEVLKSWRDVASHQQGCLALNSCMNNMVTECKEELMHYISKEADSLCEDIYGNHVVQNVLEMRNQYYELEIVLNLMGSFGRLSTLKCGSHVTEKCLRTDFWPIVVESIIKSGKLLIIAQDQYGNYVIQKALNRSKESGHEFYYTLRKQLLSVRDQLECSPYGRNVAKLLKYK